MAILLTVAMPLWKTAVQREREAELIFRGTQYARAVDLFRRKYANASPPNLDILLNERFLRKKYKDPMTSDGEFQLLYAAQQQAGVPGGGVPGGATPGAVQPTPPRPIAGALPPSGGVSPLDRPTQGPAGARGGIIGVVSKSTATGLRLFNGRSKYNEWAFTPQTTLGNRAFGSTPQPGQPEQPGMRRPGGPGGTQRPGLPMPGQPGQPPQKPPSPFGVRPPG
jgi:hypothetical protein